MRLRNNGRISPSSTNKRIKRYLADNGVCSSSLAVNFFEVIRKKRTKIVCDDDCETKTLARPRRIDKHMQKSEWKWNFSANKHTAVDMTEVSEKIIWWLFNLVQALSPKKVFKMEKSLWVFVKIFAFYFHKFSVQFSTVSLFRPHIWVAMFSAVKILISSFFLMIFHLKANWKLSFYRN